MSKKSLGIVYSENEAVYPELVQFLRENVVMEKAGLHKVPSPGGGESFSRRGGKKGRKRRKREIIEGKNGDKGESEEKKTKGMKN